MFKTKKKYLVLLTAAMLMIPMIINAQAPEPDRGHPKEQCLHEKGPHPMIPDLTEKQKEKMKELRVDHMKKVQTFKNAMGELKAQLKTLQTADKPNMNKIYSLIDEIGEKHTEIMKLKAAHMLEIRKLLTDEQRVFFDAHMHDRNGQKMKHHGMQMQKKHH